MDVIRNKIKLIDRKEGTLCVFLSGIPQEISGYLEKAMEKFADPESRYGILVEPYVAVVEAPKKAEGK